MNRRSLLQAAAACALLLSTVPPAAAEALDDLKKAGVLKVAVPQDFPPVRFGRHRPEAAGLRHRRGRADRQGDRGQARAWRR